MHTSCHAPASLNALVKSGASLILKRCLDPDITRRELAFFDLKLRARGHAPFEIPLWLNRAVVCFNAESCCAVPSSAKNFFTKCDPSTLLRKSKMETIEAVEDKLLSGAPLGLHFYNKLTNFKSAHGTIIKFETHQNACGYQIVRIQQSNKQM